MKLSQIGEFGLIEYIKKNESKRAGTVIGIGDDAAVLEAFRPIGPKALGLYQLITTDAFIENVHFKRKGLSFFSLGQKVMIANISDIAAMGGWPTHALVTAGLPDDLSVEQIKKLYKGINKIAKENKIDIIGGDTVASPKELILSITMLGEVEKDFLLTRSGAKVGDLICVTGSFGGPASKDYALRITDYALRVREARIIARSQIATSMIDSSDGLVRSVLELCKMSKAGARIFEDKVPIAKGANLSQALYGGEEYELVFTVPRNKLSKLKVDATIVGEIVPANKSVKLVDVYGKIKPLKSGGYEHFK